MNETTLNNGVADVLSQIRLASEAGFQATMKAATDFSKADQHLEYARKLIDGLPRNSNYVDVIRNELSDSVARIQAGIALFEQGRLAQDETVRAQLMGRASSIFLDGQYTRMWSFFAQPSLAARDATLAGGATALTISTALWLAQRLPKPGDKRRSTAPVTWLPDRPVGFEVEPASQIDPGRKIRARYRVVELPEPVSSHTVTGDSNPAYDPTLQPRRRERVSSKVQIEQMARKLNAESLLNPQANWSEGPPLVGSDGMVESGNGRMLALRQAAADYPARYAAYRQQLLARAGEFGLARDQLEPMAQPVLVRERLTDLSQEERIRFVTEANASGLARLSRVEQAQADARLIPAGFFVDLQVADSDRSLAEVLTKKVNGPLVARFLKLLPETEQTALMDRQGNLSSAGIERVERALFAYALPGERLTRLVFEEGEAIDRIGAGLKRALPKLGRLEDLVRAGQRDQALSLGPDLAVAVETMRDLRRQGVSVADYVRQTKMFERLSPLQEQWLVQLDRRRRSARAVAELINTYADMVVETAPPSQERMFGAKFKASAEQLLRSTLKAVDGTWIELSKETAADVQAAGVMQQ